MEGERVVPPPSDQSLLRYTMAQAPPRFVSAGRVAAAAAVASPSEEDSDAESVRSPALSNTISRLRSSTRATKNFKLRGHHVVLAGFVSVLTLAIIITGLLSLAQNPDRDLEKLADCQRSLAAAAQEKKELQIIVDTCRGEAGDLRGALDSAVAEHERLQDAALQSEEDAWTSDSLIFSVVAAAAVAGAVGFALKPPPRTPGRFAAGDTADLYAEGDKWEGCKVLRADANGSVVVQKLSDQSVITTKEHRLRKVTVHVVQSDLQLPSPSDSQAGDAAPCRACAELKAQIADLRTAVSIKHNAYQALENELAVEKSEGTKREAQVQVLQNEVDAFKMIEDQATRDRDRLVVLENSLREVTHSKRLAEESYHSTLQNYEAIHRERDALLAAREEGDMRRAEEIVSLASRELDQKFQKERRRRVDLEDTVQKLHARIQELEATQALVKDALRLSEATSAVAASKYLALLNPALGRETARLRARSPRRRL